MSNCTTDELLGQIRALKMVIVLLIHDSISPNALVHAYLDAFKNAGNEPQSDSSMAFHQTLKNIDELVASLKKEEPDLDSK